MSSKKSADEKLNYSTKEKKEFQDCENSQIILENLPFGCWLKGMDGKYLATNKVVEDFAGLEKKDILGKDDFEVFPQKEAELFVRRDKGILKGDSQGYYEFELDGRWTQEYKSKIVGEDGKDIGIMGFSQDITKGKLLEAALRDSEKSMAVLLSNLPGVAYRCLNDKNWTMTFLSEGCFELTGYTPEELIHEGEITYYDLIGEEDKKKVFDQWEIDLEKNQRSNDEYQITTKSGEVKWVWEQSIPVANAKGEYIESEGFILDITNIKNTEKALKESEDRFRTIFELAPLGIGIFSMSTGAARHLNRKFAEILGRNQEELMGLDWREYSHPEDIPENLEKLALLKENKINGFSINKRLYKADGSTIWVNMVIAPFETNTGEETHLCMIEDITSSKLKEQEIEYLSYHDILTGLYNRRFFEEAQKQFDARRDTPFSLIMGDVNGLKLINDSFGHAAGDRLLKEAARILQNSCRGEDFVARIGGDEFVIILDHTDSAAAEKLCKRINRTCKEYGKSEDKQTFFLSISLGFATKTSPNQTVEELLKVAEDMLYKKKHSNNKMIRKEIMNAVKNELILREDYTEEWQEEIAKAASAIGKALRLSANKMKHLELLMQMHDIGELSMLDQFSGRNSGETSEADRHNREKHPEASYRIALGVMELKHIGEEMYSHHENWDGSGYPRGIAREEIPLLARIVRVVDAYGEYAKKMPTVKESEAEEIMAYMADNAGILFDPGVVLAFNSYLKNK